MSIPTGDARYRGGPKRRQAHYSYDESVDEPAQLLEEESVDVEEAVPAEDNQSVNAADDAEIDISSPFTEGSRDRAEPHEEVQHLRR